jgi:putative IMPACT (imprinted ancient) family translation regulator
MDCTKSLLEPGSSEINIKKAKFIGFSKRCENEDEAKSLIKAVSQDHAGADHFCWAYRISLPGREVANYSDGGEPHGLQGAKIG